MGLRRPDQTKSLMRSATDRRPAAGCRDDGGDGGEAGNAESQRGLAAFCRGAGAPLRRIRDARWRVGYAT